MQEDHRFASTGNNVFQVDTVHPHAFHGISFSAKMTPCNEATSDRLIRSPAWHSSICYPPNDGTRLPLPLRVLVIIYYVARRGVVSRLTTKHVGCTTRTHNSTSDRTSGGCVERWQSPASCDPGAPMSNTT